jgi:hypothetical protein
MQVRRDGDSSHCRARAEFQEIPGETEADALLRGTAPNPAGLASALSGADGATRVRAVNRLQQERGNVYVQRVVAGARRATHVQRQAGEEEPPGTTAAGNAPEMEPQAERVREGEEGADTGEVGAELEARDALAANSATQAPNPEIEAQTEEMTEAGVPPGMHISRCPAGTIRIQRKKAPPAGPARAGASQVTLEFIPDEKLDANGPLGVIHVRVKGKEVARFFARGGPPPSKRGRDPYAPGHFIAPTPAGRYKLGPGIPAIAPSWAFSQLAWGTPMREVDTPGGKDVQYKSGRRWRSTVKLKTPLPRDAILAAEEAVGRARAIPAKWDLNDFGKLAFQVRGTHSFIHTTPESEEHYRTGRPETLTFSHGCIHVKPSDRVIMMARGYLQGGVKLIVRKYRAPAKWGTSP